MKRVTTLFLGICMGLISHAQPAGNEAEPLRRAEKAVTDVMVHDIFSPPVAARIYLYTNIAAYETLVKANPSLYASLYGQVKGFPVIPDPKGKISFSLASVYAFLQTGKKFFFSEPSSQDSIRTILKVYKRKNIGPPQYKPSINNSSQVADSTIP